MQPRQEGAARDRIALAEVLVEIRDMLRQLDAAALIREDALAAELYADLARAEDMEAFHATLSRLGDRVDEIAFARTGIAPGARARMSRLAPQHAAARDDVPAPRARTFLKL